MASHDLSKTIIPYLDRHLVFPLLAHLAEMSIFPRKEVQIAQYELAKGTNMFDYAVSLFKGIYPDKDVPSGPLFMDLTNIQHADAPDRVRSKTTKCRLYKRAIATRSSGGFGCH